MKTLIQGGDIVGYADGGHRLVRGGAVVFEDDRVTFVGHAFTGAVDRRIDGTGKLVIPGLVNIHCHADTEAGGRLIADVGRRDYFHTGYLNYYAAKKGVKPLGPRQDPEIGGRFAMTEMLRNGCTTVVDIGVAAESHARIAGDLGLRAYVSPAYKSADYCLTDAGQIYFDTN
jgi:5-methylthioadenosine/S-adenosylhomocysteine deaminase